VAGSGGNGGVNTGTWRWARRRLTITRLVWRKKREEAGEEGGGEGREGRGRREHCPWGSMPGRGKSGPLNWDERLAGGRIQDCEISLAVYQQTLSRRATPHLTKPITAAPHI